MANITYSPALGALGLQPHPIVSLGALPAPYAEHPRVFATALAILGAITGGIVYAAAPGPHRTRNALSAAVIVPAISTVVMLWRARAIAQPAPATPSVAQTPIATPSASSAVKAPASAFIAGAHVVVGDPNSGELYGTGVVVGPDPAVTGNTVVHMDNNASKYAGKSIGYSANQILRMA